MRLGTQLNHKVDKHITRATLNKGTHCLLQQREMAFPKKRILPPPPKAKDRHRRMPLVGQTTDIKSAGVQVGVYTCYTYSCIFIYICIINFLYPKLTAPSVLLPFSKHQELSSGEGEAKECYFNKPCANAYMYKRTKDHLPFHILALALKTWFP